MNINTKVISAGTAMLALAALGSAQIYEQTGPSNIGHFSDAVAGQFWDTRAADNFTLTAAANVGGITWTGGSENFVGPGDLSNFSDFVIRIYSDAAGTVGAEAWSGTFATAATNPVDTGLFSWQGGHIYNHTVTTGGVALGVGSYWISIGSVNVSPGDDAYLWASTLTPYDGNSLDDSPFGTGYTNAVADDLVFGLHVVPEPATFVILGLGLAGLAAQRRRK